VSYIQTTHPRELVLGYHTILGIENIIKVGSLGQAWKYRCLLEIFLKSLVGIAKVKKGGTDVKTVIVLLLSSFFLLLEFFQVYFWLQVAGRLLPDLAFDLFDVILLSSFCRLRCR
jgi:hypothetical protein